MKKIIAFFLMSGLFVTGLYAEGIEFHKNADKNDANYVKYIPKNRAVRIAYELAGVNADEVAICKAKIDKDKSSPVYEIEFIVDGTEYEIDIDALTGSVVGMEADQAQGPRGPYNGFIGVEKAKSIALNCAGIKPASNVRYEEIKLGRDDGLIVYELEFLHNGKKYEYEIEAITGKVLEAK